MTLKDISQEFGFRSIIDEADEGIIVTRAHPIVQEGPEIVYINDAMVHISGYRRDELIGKTPRLLQCPNTSENTRHMIHEHLAKKLPLRCRILNAKKNGKRYWVEMSIVPLKNGKGEVTHFASIQRDITHFKEIEDALGNASVIDTQTSVHSTTAFLEALDTEWHRAYRHHSSFCILTFTLKHRSGQHIGLDDNQLAAIGRICLSLFRKEDTVGRTGLDEFSVLMPETGLNLAISAVNRLASHIESDDHLSSYIPSTGTAEFELLDEQSIAILERARQNRQG